MQRQELNVKGARGDAKELAELAIPGKYRWVPEGVVTDSRYKVAQLYARLAEGSDARQHEKCDCDGHQGRVGKESSKASRAEDGETEIR
jgi:hypothetical protein